jgi:hypothetical protein
VNVDHATIVGTDPSAEGVRAEASDNANADSATINVTNSVIEDVGTPIRRVADNMDVANVTTTYSNYDPAGNLQSNGASGVGAITEANRTDLPPNFGVGFHLLATSPLIDIGDPAAPAPGTLDFDQQARAIMGTPSCTVRRDIGADEFVPVFPIAPPAYCNPTALTPTPVTSNPPGTSPKKKCKKKRKKKGAAAAKKCKKRRR